MQKQTPFATSLGFLLLVVCATTSFTLRAAAEVAEQKRNSSQEVASISDSSEQPAVENSTSSLSAKWSNWSDRIFRAPFQHRGWWHSDSVDFPPLGDNLSQIIKLHRKAARPMRLLIYRYDFVDQSAVLNEMGQRQVSSIAKRMDKTDQPVILQPSQNADLDLARRKSILNALNKLNVHNAEKRVLIKSVYYPRLRGSEGEQVNERRRQQQPFTGDKTGGNPN